jgi:hypothetical protein
MRSKLDAAAGMVESESALCWLIFLIYFCQILAGVLQKNRLIHLNKHLIDRHYGLVLQRKVRSSSAFAKPD